MPNSQIVGSPEFEVDNDEVRKHYDRLSFLYKLFWGEHLHHGYWEDNESIERAQVRLMERLAEKAKIPNGAEVLDIGCGIGGSAFWLAQQYDCTVTGMTISPVQAKLATKKARKQRLAKQLRFLVGEADFWQPQPASVDVIWIMESSEHFRNKGDFFRRCASALKPGGILAVCAWLRGEQSSSDREQKLVATVARAMFSASLDTLTQYAAWVRAANLKVETAEDITRNIAPTWQYCSRLIDRWPLKWLVNFADEPTRRFVKSFPLMTQAYATGAMAYGLFVARKPADNSDVFQSPA
jgi:tocopherol O-methyltransferase